MDMMFKALDEAAWDAFSATFPAEANILIDEIGPIVITPAVVDPDGTIITPAVIDPAWHVNVRVLRPYVEDNIDVCADLAKGVANVEWIDPTLVTSPDRIWAGGMDYWVPGLTPNP